MTDNSAYGQQTPFDSSTDFTSIRFLIRQMMAQMETMMPVQVMAVHGGGGAIAAAGTVDVLPLVSLLDGAGNPTPQGTVYGLPWWRLQGNGSAIVCDPAVGDIGYVIAASRDISSVVRTGAAANPGSLRKYSISDGIYIGGCLNGAPTQYLAFNANGITISDLNGNSIAMTAGGIAVTGNVAVTGTITATGVIIAGYGGADQVGLQTHEHTANNTPPTPGT